MASTEDANKKSQVDISPLRAHCPAATERKRGTERETSYNKQCYSSTQYLLPKTLNTCTSLLIFDATDIEKKLMEKRVEFGDDIGSKD